MLQSETNNDFFDLVGLMPPLPLEQAKKLNEKTGANFSNKHTYLPFMISRTEFEQNILPTLKESCPEELTEFICARVEKTFELRHKLKLLRTKIEQIVGVGNFSALWLDREAFSADSMEHRALITEAVIHVYSALSLQKIVQLLYHENIPMIPYGEGGGYNMGVTPMAPAVTISVRGIDHISEISTCQLNSNKYEITVGSGVPFKDLVNYIQKRGFVLRCDPNTPRAATGGIAATGSNGGRKAFEVITRGRAVTANGIATRFAVNEQELNFIESEPFLLANKFFSIQNVHEFEEKFKTIEKENRVACTMPSLNGVNIALKGEKASANALLQKYEASQALSSHNEGLSSRDEGLSSHNEGLSSHNEDLSSRDKGLSFPRKRESKDSRLDPPVKPGDDKISYNDTMKDLPALPISAFVGSEGCTGFIYEVTFQIEKPKQYLTGSRIHFKSVEAAIHATKSVKKLPKEHCPEYFEIISGHSIKRYLIHDFPSIFSTDDAAVIIVGVEGDTKDLCLKNHSLIEAAIFEGLNSAGLNKEQILRFEKIEVLDQTRNTLAFEHLKKPREELPKKLRTKCKTDMEIKTEYLGEVFKIVERTLPKTSKTHQAIEKQDVLFGHLTPNHSAIIHWNIGGFDLYNEEQADIAWDYLADVIDQSLNLAPQNDKTGSARFTGEHGIAGKAPFLWINYIDQNDFKRMCDVKKILDPKDLYNPDTIFLRTSLVRRLRARLLNTSAQIMKQAFSNKESKNSLEKNQQYIVEEGLKCTRCNSCKICPVIDAEHELEREGKRNSNTSVLPSKRNILMFLEKIVHIQKFAASVQDKKYGKKIMQSTEKMLLESKNLLKKCFYCRRCDKACPVDIEIHPLMNAYKKLGKISGASSRLWSFIYERLMGEDIFKSYTFKLIALINIISNPFLKMILKIKSLPNWMKTYAAVPKFSFAHYEPTQHGIKLNKNDNFVLIAPLVDPPVKPGDDKHKPGDDKHKPGDDKHKPLSLPRTLLSFPRTLLSFPRTLLSLPRTLLSLPRTRLSFPRRRESKENDKVTAHENAFENSIFIRYRGCMDTFANPLATTQVDTYFKEHLGARIVDLEKKMCCGFPFEADGLHERARQLQKASLIEIIKCISSLMQNQKTTFDHNYLLFSNCPTCTEALGEMKKLLLDASVRNYIKLVCKLDDSFDLLKIKLSIVDTAEIALQLIQELHSKNLFDLNKINKEELKIGLKVPCHNTSSATKAQIELLKLYYTGVAGYDKCCGLSGTGRIKHPKIGTKISEKLFEMIEEHKPDIVVSGCPSCRDGVNMQRQIIAETSNAHASFPVTGIFEQIVKDFPTCPR